VRSARLQIETSRVQHFNTCHRNLKAFRITDMAMEFRSRTRYHTKDHHHKIRTVCLVVALFCQPVVVRGIFSKQSLCFQSNIRSYSCSAKLSTLNGSHGTLRHAVCTASTACTRTHRLQYANIFSHPAQHRIVFATSSEGGNYARASAQLLFGSTGYFWNDRTCFSEVGGGGGGTGGGGAMQYHPHN
jgi:hypothetical protein